MSSKFKVISISFHLDRAYPPFNIIGDLTNYFNANCVASVNAFSGDVIICTLFGEEVINKLKNIEGIFINNKLRKYKIVETNITGICVKLDYRGITAEDVSRVLRQHGTILKSEVLLENGTPEDDMCSYDHRFYYAMIDLRKNLPTRLKIRQETCVISEL